MRFSSCARIIGGPTLKIKWNPLNFTLNLSRGLLTITDVKSLQKFTTQNSREKLEQNNRLDRFHSHQISGDFYDLEAQECILFSTPKLDQFLLQHEISGEISAADNSPEILRRQNSSVRRCYYWSARSLPPWSSHLHASNTDGFKLAFVNSARSRPPAKQTYNYPWAIMP